MLDNKKITIHQPDFMPWMGFFNKLSKVDIFVCLDHVLNNPKAEFWGRRVKVNINKEARWFGIPIKKPKELFVPINEMIIINDKKNIKKSLATIFQNYSKTPYFKDFFPIIEDYYYSEENSLTRRNMSFIKEVLRILNINVEIYYSSQIKPKGDSTEMLLDIVQKLEGDEYICGMGAMNYQNDNMFVENGIKVTYNSFIPKSYYQSNSNEFISGLSILDSLMNIGASETEKIVKELKNESSVNR